MPEDKVNTSEDSLADERDVGSSDGEETDSNVSEDAVSQATQEKTLKDVLGEQLGKDFPSDEAALKAVKDTFSYTGKYGKLKPYLDKAEESVGGEQALIKKMEELAKQQDQQQSDSGEKAASPALDPENFVSRDEYERERFYREHPDYDNDKVKRVLGDKPFEAIKDDSTKEIVDDLLAHAEAENAKSVLESNPRLGQTKDKLSQAREKVKSGDIDGGKRDAVSAVMDIME